MNPAIYGDVKWTGNPELDAIIARKTWAQAARPKQLLNLGRSAYGYVCLMGRGFGKTLLGTHTIRDIALKYPGIRINAIGATSDAVRGIIFEGESGLLSCIPPSCIKKSNRRPLELELWNGSYILGVSAEDPERLRGYQSAVTLADELAAWQYPKESFEQIVLSTRLRTEFKTKLIITTTPKPIPLIYDLVDDPRYIKVFGSTYENLQNLDENAIAELRKMEGTNYGKQEIYGELLMADQSAIFKRDWFNIWPKDDKYPNFSYIIQSWDTAYTKNTANDPCAVTTWGVFSTETIPFGIMILDAWDEHLDYPSMRTRAQYEYNKGHGPEGKLFITHQVVEMKGTGMPLYQDLSDIGIPILGSNPGTNDKVTRASLVSYLAEKGNIYVPENPRFPSEVAPWAEAWLQELTRFSSDPAAMKSQKDDYVDSTSQAWKHIIDMGFGRRAFDGTGSNNVYLPQKRNNPYLI